MHCTESFYVVVAVGFRHKEFIRLEDKVATAALPVFLVEGGHISEGSNAGCNACKAAKSADLVLWQPDGARHFSAGLVPSLPMARVNGVSSAFNALVRWLTTRQ
jgi:hypothetical protein